MTLLNLNMKKTVRGNTDLELEADPGESFLVKNIQICNPAADYLDVLVDRMAVGFFRTGGVLGSHLGLPVGRTQHAHDLITGATAVGDETEFVGLDNAGGVEVGTQMIGNVAVNTTLKRVGVFNDAAPSDYMTILEYLWNREIFKGYPVPTGSKLLLTGAAQADAVQIVTYDRYTEGDIQATQENGIESKEFFFINYGNCGAAINNAGDHEVDTPKNPAEFQDFPYGDDCPAKHEFDLHGILASDFAPIENDGTDGSGTLYLKLTKDRTVLFDEDRNGLLLDAKDYGDDLPTDYIAEGYSVIGNKSTVDQREPFMINPPMMFEEGDELTVEHTVQEEGTGADIGVLDHEVGFIFRVRKL